VLNLKTAEMIEFIVPLPLFTRADEVID